MVTRMMEAMRKLLYRGKIKKLIIKYRINDNLRNLYWRMHRRSVDDEIEVTIGNSTAVFPISTYSEYRVINTVQREERPVVRKILSRLDTDDVIWDIGANIGTFSCMMGDILKQGEIVCFEPYPPNIDKLEKNLDRNFINGEIVPVALSNTDNIVSFHAVHADEAGTQQGSIASDYADINRSKETIKVNCVTGDQLVSENKVPIPDVVKIDVEGAGVEVIDGMVETLASPNCRLVVVESHENRSTIAKKLCDIGFEINGIELAGGRENEPSTVLATKN
jgi:FkbM family methyltransferase